MSVAVVTGGGGFLGSHVVNLICEQISSRETKSQPHAYTVRLLAEMEEFAQVRVVDVAPRPDFLDDRVQYFQGSVEDTVLLRRAFTGAHVVFHLASIVDWGQRPYSVLHKINVEGTQNVIEACKTSGVKRLVYTSTVDVVCWNDHELYDTPDEKLSIPPPGKFLYGSYAVTKAEAEIMVCRANSDKLHTVIIRPSGMYGERDVYHLPNVLQAARSGQMLVRLGHSGIRFQHTYAGNTAFGHLCAARALLSKPNDVAGNAYVITDSPAENMWDFFEPFVRASGHWMPPPWLYLPKPAAYAIAYLLATISWLVSPLVAWTPTLTPGALKGVLYSQSFAGNAAVRDLDYTPLVPADVAKAQTMKAFFPNLADTDVAKLIHHGRH